MAEEIKRIHLKDLIAPGKEITIKVVDPVSMDETEAVVFMHKPSATQQQDAISKARASAARRRAVLRNTESDEYVALKSQVDEADVDELAQTLVSFKLDELRTQAREEVLHQEGVGTDWGPEGHIYYDNADAIAERMQELRDEAGNDDFDPLEDEEIKRLTAVQDKFWSEVTDRFDALKAMESNRIKMEMTPDKMRSELLKKLIDTEYNISWMQDYQLHMLMASIRDPDNRKKSYFSSIEELVSVPEYVLDQLWAGFSDVNATGDTIKNLHSLRLS